MSAGIIPDLASNAAQESSMDTVPIIITTSKTRSSSAAPNKVKSQTVFMQIMRAIKSVMNPNIVICLFPNFCVR